MTEEYFTLITGASRGIGKAIAFELGSRGHNLILHSLPGEGLEKICEDLAAKFSIKTSFFEIDLTLNDGPVTLFKLIDENKLIINILINNAGIGIEGPIEKYTPADIDNMIFLNVRALTLLTYYFIPQLKQTPSYILNLSSFGSYIPTAYKSIYLATKSYIYFFTRALESEFRGTSVRTCMLVPSGVRTNPKVLIRIERAGPVSRATVLSPEEVAAAGVKGMFSGRRVIMPGRLNRFIFSFCLFIPEGIIMALMRRLFRNETVV
jgi:short-subunit dehydrogenase